MGIVGGVFRTKVARRGSVSTVALSRVLRVRNVAITRVKVVGSLRGTVGTGGMVAFLKNKTM